MWDCKAIHSWWLVYQQSVAKAFTAAMLGWLTLVVTPLSAVAEMQDATPSQLLERAHELRLELKWDEAIAVLRDIVARWQENESKAGIAQMRIGRYLVDRGDPGVAEAELRLVIERYPSEQTAVWQAKVAMIDALLTLKRHEEAAGLADALLAEAVESDEFRTWAQVKQAEILMAQGRSGIAVERFLSVARQTGVASGEPVNWARVQLMNIYAGQWRSAQVEKLCQTVLDEHALGKATDQQTAWALMYELTAK